MKAKKILLLASLFLLLTGSQFALRGQNRGSALSAYEKFLDTLDNSKKESILAARNEFLKNFITAENEIAAQAFRCFWKFYRKFIREQDKLLHSNEYHLTDAEKPGVFEELQRLHNYDKYGIKLSAEGTQVYLAENVDFLVKTATVLKGEFREYINFHANEFREPITGDASLGIYWEELRKRILRFERFAREHPDLLETETKIKPELDGLLWMYLVGLDNTPAYDLHDTGELDAELRKSYATFLTEDHTSSNYSLISETYKILEKHAFKMNAELLAFLHERGFADNVFNRNAEAFLKKRENYHSRPQSTAMLKPEPSIVFLGMYSNMRYTEEHAYGTQLELWQQDEQFFGHFLHSMGLMGDTPTGRLEKFIFDPKTKRLSFTTRLTLGLHDCSEHESTPSRDVFEFEGVFSREAIIGTLKHKDAFHPETPATREEIVLKKIEEKYLGKIYKNRAEWEEDSRQILAFRGPKW
jgi:hypothetical protein